MKKNIKKIAMLVMIFVLAMSLVACGGKNKKASDSEPNHFTLGDYEINLKEAFLMKDDDKDLIVLKMDFTNHSKEANSYLVGIGPDVTQNDKELEPGIIFLSEDSLDTIVDGQLEDIEPGKTVEIFDAYELDNLKDQVVVKFWIVATDEIKSIKLDPDTLQLKDSLK